MATGRWLWSRVRYRTWRRSPELEAELLKAVNGPHVPFSEGELRELANKALGERRARGQK